MLHYDPQHVSSSMLLILGDQLYHHSFWYRHHL